MEDRMSLRIGAIHRRKLEAMRITRAQLILGPKGTGRGKVAVRQSSVSKQQIGIVL